MAEADAGALIEKYGDLAYDESRRRSREQAHQTVLEGNRPRGHWALVRRIISEREGRDGVDTATRYLER
jgi:hypothetical protein